MKFANWLIGQSAYQLVYSSAAFCFCDAATAIASWGATARIVLHLIVVFHDHII